MIIVQVAQLLLALTILVFVHELGHFMAARMFNIKVDKFYIFFDAWGKKLFSWKRGDTEYGIGWLPLGGYVKISGMVDESMDKEQLKNEPQPWEFRSKPNWQKFIVMIAGIVMNVILGVIIYVVYLNYYQKDYIPISAVNEFGIYANKGGESIGLKTGDKLIAVGGKEYQRLEDYAGMKVMFGSDLTVERAGEKIELEVPGDFFEVATVDGFFSTKNETTIDSVLQTGNTNAKNAGIQNGDIIKQINHSDLFCFSEFADKISEKKNDSIIITVERNGALHDFKVAVDSLGKIGIAISIVPSIKDKVDYTLNSSLKYGTRDAFEVFFYQAIGIWKIITGEVSARDSIQSPIGITKIFPSTWDWGAFWRLTALLSMVLGFMNLLPIPALDGGHIMFIGIETIIRRKLSDKFMERAQVVGMVILLSLMVFAVGNDLFKIFQ